MTRLRLRTSPQAIEVTIFFRIEMPAKSMEMLATGADSQSAN